MKLDGLDAIDIAPSNSFFPIFPAASIWGTPGPEIGGWQHFTKLPGDTQSLAKVVAEVTAVAPHDPNLQIFKQTLDPLVIYPPVN